MSRETVVKFAQFFLIVLAGVALDQWSKLYAESRLATQRLNHEIVLVAPTSQTVDELLAAEFTANTPEQNDRIAARYVRDAEDQRMSGDAALAAGDQIKVIQREIVVVPDYFDFQYTRNPGAAFGILAGADSPWRAPFFLIVSSIALIVIVFMLRGTALRQQTLIWGLSLVASGALGNLIDRARLDYVIDFIVWKYTDAHRWPTFNVADALICIGVGLMIIEMIRDARRAKEQPAQADASEPAA